MSKAEPEQKPQLNAKLLWQCHRGMLELDLILQKFIRNHYESLTAKQAETFHEVLSQSDPILLSWLMGHSKPDDAELAEMVSLIRSSYS
jgi:antitoxin CptB